MFVLMNLIIACSLNYCKHLKSAKLHIFKKIQMFQHTYCPHKIQYEFTAPQYVSIKIIQCF